jgi:N12 class adenine-specific DNA methylase/adenine-specific DNA methylase
MPAKVDTYLDLARETALGLSGSVDAWTAFLDTASRLYKYPFADQLMIHAQRPGATACASYEVWNDTMRRYVRRGAKGIALLDNSGDTPKLRYVFDIADTGTRRSSRPFSPWEINDGNLAEVQLGLKQDFGTNGEWLSSQLQDVARDLAEMYFDAHRHDIAGIIDGSLMAGYDEGELRDSFIKAAYASTAYALLSRCGYDPAAYFDEADFAFISEWDTSEAVTALGTAVSENAQMVLRQIERTIRSYERSQNHARDNLHDRERRPTAEPEPNGDGANRPLREDAPEVSAGAPANTVEPAPDKRDSVAAPARDGGSGAAADRPDAAEAGGGSGRDGGAESRRPDEVDGAHEQLQGSGRRSSSERIDLQLNFFDEAEDAQAPSAFSFPQDVMDDVLRLGGNTDELRMRVVAEFEKRRSIDEIAAFLPTVYHGGNGFTVNGDKYAVWFSDDGIRVAQGEQARYERGAQLIPWAEAAVRIGELLDAGRYATKVEVAGAEDYEHELIARKLRNLQHDLSKGNEGLFPNLADVDGGYPEAVQKIAAKLADPEGREAVLGDYLAFREAYKADRSVLRFHYHDVDGIFVSLAVQLLERRKFASDMERVPNAYGFITQDEIDKELCRGGGRAGSKWRIFRYFTEEHSRSEKAAVLKELYGTGGRGHALSGASGSNESYDAKGIRLEKLGCEVVNLTWSAVARRIDELIASDRYMTETELAEYDLHTAAYAKYRNINTSNIEEIVLVEQGGNYYTYRPDAEQVSRTLDLREQHAGGLDYVVIPGEQLDAALEKLRSRSAVIYMDEAGVEHTLPFIISGAERVQYEKQLVEALVNDSAYVNAVRNSDRQNAIDEGFAAIRRIAAASTDIRFLKLYHDNAEFRNCLRNDALAAAYKEVSERGNVYVEQNESSHEPTPATYIPVDGEWQGFPSVAAAQEAALEEFRKETQRRARNFRITDDHLGEGGAKAKCRANIEAIRLLKYLEENGFQASPEQQDKLSGYVGWGGIPEVFDENKPDWSKEYAELKALLTPEEYEAARGSTLNAHYTSPAVIRAIYEAVGSMGFEGGRILEPSMGVGNFFGLLPESMQGSQLHGVELDSITGRIAKQLYPEADITVAGFETTSRPGFYDLAVGNVPFGQYQVHDPEYDRLGFSIHNYFAAKMLDQVRPGGLVAFVTSRYTLDAKDESVRRYLAERGELLGAIRLPNNAFRANAGTDVVSDIIFLQRREQPLTELPDWVHVGTTPEGFTVNRYFIDHPDMVLGTPSSESTQYGRQDYTVAPIEGADLSELLHLAVQNIHGEYTEREMEEAERSDILPADPDVRNYSFTLVDGEVYYREGGIMVRQDVSAAMTERIKGLMELRDCTRKLIQLQTEDASDAETAAEQQRLNTLYDAYTAKHGLISNRENKRAFSDDSSYYLLCSLEILSEDGKLERKADMFTRRTIQPHRPVEHTETAAEALAVSLNELGRVDMQYMSRLCGRDTSSANEKSQPRRSTNPSPGAASYTATDSNSSIPAENKDVNSIAAELSDVIFRVPGTDRYVTADEYLSGNVREKLREAEAAAKADQSFNINVEALKAAQPRELTASEIDVRLGATWIEPRYIEQFMVETFQPTYWASRSMDVSYSPYTSEWHIDGKNAVGANDVNAFSTYGTSRISAYKILENTLNLRDVRIYDKVEDADGTERRVLNVKETTLAQQKQQVIKDAFRDWLWKDPKRRETLVAKYNELFNSTRPREYDGSHLTFPGINPEIELREHQRNAIARILYGGNTLLAHEVGAGKTFTMAAAAMEAKRLGLCRKPMFAVPNHLTEQWASEFLRLYPSANILVATKKDFEPANRKKFCARIATGDYDAVIIGHSQFERIPVSQERQERLLRSEIEEITEGINQLKRSSGERFSIKSMEKTKKSLEAKLKKLLDSPKDDVVTFEELGVDRLFVDEAHSYKNLYYHTKMQNVAGLSSAEAQKSSDMYMKCRYMDELTGSRGIVFATGTPVSNSMTELYTMQRYLQHDTLERLGLGHFDSWAANFGETVTALELAPEGTGYRARTRFSKFFNLPELMNLFREVADIKTSDQLMLPTPEVVYHNEVSQPTEIQKKLVQELSERATKVHARMVDPSEDNMLAITNDGRKLGLDQRVVNPLLPDADGTKVNRCVDNVFRIWQDGAREKLTQLIFCDLSTPGKGFNVYDDIKKKLAARGVPESEIAFIHAADTDMKKKELFAKVRSGNVRVLLGSTAKMGAGTNVQDRLVALHDLDAPWRPGDLEQRKGRIARQGNMNETVHVYRYVTEQTFDSYIWQTLENKQRFISQIMTSKSPVRSCEDTDETTLSYAEVKALCAGDPRIREKMDLDVQVAKLRLLKSSHQSQKYHLEDRLLQYYPREIAATKAAIMGCEADVATRDAHPAPADIFAGIELRGLHYDERVAAGEALMQLLPTIMDTDPVHVGTFRGFDVEVSLEAFGKHVLTLKGTLEHHVELGADARGNVTRIENALTALDKKLGALNTRLSDLQRQVENAREELEKPFPQEDELREKSARLVELNAELDMENNAEPQEAEKPSVLKKLKEPIPLYEPKPHQPKEACR